MSRFASEQEFIDFFEDRFRSVCCPVMLEIERETLGTDFGASSWSPPGQIDLMIDFLGLGPGSSLLDVGSGSGWPGLYVAASRGCSLTLLDRPVTGLKVAMDRARRDGLAAPGVVVGEGGSLPFRDHAFDAVSHSDVLCCLPRKRDTLAECRRVCSGRMAFTVVETDRAQLDIGPEYVVSEAPYPELLDATGWHLLERIDVTEDFGDLARRMLTARSSRVDALSALFGAVETADLLKRTGDLIDGVHSGVLTRTIYVAE